MLGLQLCFVSLSATAAGSNNSSFLVFVPSSLRPRWAMHWALYMHRGIALWWSFCEVLTSLENCKVWAIKSFLCGDLFTVRVCGFFPLCIHFSCLLCLFLLACASYCQPFHSTNFALTDGASSVLRCPEGFLATTWSWGPQLSQQALSAAPTWQTLALTRFLANTFVRVFHFLIFLIRCLYVAV